MKREDVQNLLDRCAKSEAARVNDEQPARADGGALMFAVGAAVCDDEGKKAPFLSILVPTEDTFQIGKSTAVILSIPDAMEANLSLEKLIIQIGVSLLGARLAGMIEDEPQKKEEEEAL